MQYVSINLIEVNKNNPRIIRDDKFKKLVQSIIDFPEMLEKRPIVVNKDMIVLGGNMRLRACKEAGLQKIPVEVVDWSEAKQREFIIKDNISGGEWDWSDIANNWNTEQLDVWGLDIPDFAIHPADDELTADDKNKAPSMKITFPSPDALQHAESHIQELINRICPEAYYSVSAGDI